MKQVRDARKALAIARKASSSTTWSACRSTDKKAKNIWRLARSGSGNSQANAAAATKAVTTVVISVEASKVSSRGKVKAAQGADIPSVAHPQGLPPLRRDHSNTFDELLSGGPRRKVTARSLPGRAVRSSPGRGSESACGKVPRPKTA